MPQLSRRRASAIAARRWASSTDALSARAAGATGGGAVGRGLKRPRAPDDADDDDDAAGVDAPPPARELRPRPAAPKSLAESALAGEAAPSPAPPPTPVVYLPPRGTPTWSYAATQVAASSPQRVFGSAMHGDGVGATCRLPLSTCVPPAQRERIGRRHLVVLALCIRTSRACGANVSLHGRELWDAAMRAGVLAAGTRRSWVEALTRGHFVCANLEAAAAAYAAGEAIVAPAARRSSAGGGGAARAAARGSSNSSSARSTQSSRATRTSCGPWPCC